MNIILTEENQQLDFDSPDFNRDEYYEIKYEEYLLFVQKIQYLSLQEYVKFIRTVEEKDIYYSNKDNEDNELYEMKGYYQYDEKNPKVVDIYNKNPHISTKDFIYCYYVKTPSVSFHIEKVVKLFKLLCKGVVHVDWDYDNLDEDGLPTAICSIADLESVNDVLSMFAWNPYWDEWNDAHSHDLYNFLIDFNKTMSNDIADVQEQWRIESESDYKYVINSLDSSVERIGKFSISNYIDYQGFTFAQLSLLFENIDHDVYTPISALYERNDNIKITFYNSYSFNDELNKIKAHLTKLPLYKIYPLLSILYYIKGVYVTTFTYLWQPNDKSERVLLNDENEYYNSIIGLYESLCKDTNGNFDAMKYMTLNNEPNFPYLIFLNKQAKAIQDTKNKKLNNNNNDENK